MIIPDTKSLTPAFSGDPAALNEVFDFYRPHVYAIALNICGNTPEAEDAVQDAFLLAYTRMHQLKDPDAFFSWLSRIVRNCCYQALRKNKLLLPGEYLSTDDRLIEESVEQHFEHLAVRDSLYTALSKLPEQLRTAMMLRYLTRSNSYQQIAEIMDVPIGTVRSRLSEGKKQLNKHWKIIQHAGDSEYNRSSRWNSLYTEWFTGVYDDESYLPQTLRYIDVDFRIIFTSGKTARGRRLFAEVTYDAIEHGSRMSQVNNSFSSGNITLMDVRFSNSSEHPDHCPPGSFLVIKRKGDIITDLRLYHRARPGEEKKTVLSQFA